MSDYGALADYGWQPDFTKDPDETIDFAFNWKPLLDDDTISTCDFLLPDGLAEVSSSNTTTEAAIFVSGGSEGCTYRITNRIVTTGGRTRDQTIYVLVRE